MFNMFKKRTPRSPRSQKIAALSSKYPKQYNLRLNQKQRNIIADFQNLKRQGLVDFTVAQLFRDVIDNHLQAQLEALIQEKGLMKTNHDFSNHPKRK